MARHTISILLLCELLAAGCDSSTSTPPMSDAGREDGGGASYDGGVDAGPPDAGPDLRFATFNAGLAPGDIPNVAERRQPIIDALTAADLDVVCLQEIWQQADWMALKTALMSSMPNTVRHARLPPTSGCTAEEIGPLGACATAACSDPGPDGLAACAVAHCGAELGALSPGCIGCVTGHLDGTIADIVAACPDPGTPATGAGCLYDGTFDTGILTGLPIVEQDSFALDSYLVCTDIDYARVTTPSGDEVNVFCTHLASNVGDFPYHGAFGSWDGERTHQVGQLLAYIAEKAPAGSRVVVLGDLNSGPAVASAGIVATAASDLQMLVASGLTSPFQSQADVDCTVCPDNTMRADDSSPLLLDHALIRGFTGSPVAHRIFTDPVTIDVAGTAMMSSLSDHYGLELDLPAGG